MIQLLCLNYILDKKDKAFIINNNLDESFFSDYKDEFKFIKSHINTFGNVPDTTVVLSSFNDFQLVKVNETPQYLLDELYKDRNKRELAFAFNQVAQLVNQDKVDDALAIFSKSYEKISRQKNIRSTDLIEDKSRYTDYVERCNDYNKYYVTTGFREVDEIIGGWDRREEVAIIAGRLGTGKSWLMLKCAVAAAQAGLRVGIYSGEMGTTKVGYRVDTLLSHISNMGMTHGNVGIQNDYKAFLDSIKDSVKGTIKVLTPKDLGGYATVSTLGAFIDRDNLDMLCIDQFSLMEDEQKGRTDRENLANISKDLLKLQKQKQIPIIEVAQQNREEVVEGEETKNIGGSDRPGQDATTVLMFEQKDNVLTIKIAKTRDNGGFVKLRYAINLDKGVFTYLPNEDDALGGADSDSLRDEYEYVDGDNPF